jgi:hypothetical protein
MHSNHWRLEASHAQLAAAPRTAQLELGDLGLGLIFDNLAPSPFLRLLALQADAWHAGGPPLRDGFVRGNDLIAYYEPVPHWPVALELHWRAYPPLPEHAWQLDLQVSAHTDLLDSDPQLEVISRAAAREVFDISPRGTQPSPLERGSRGAPATSATLVRLAGGELSLVHMVHPTDFCAALVSSESRDFGQLLKLQHRLFGERLEKGVIRRARIRCQLVPQADDLARARAAFTEFSTEDPDLSA